MFMTVEPQLKKIYWSLLSVFFLFSLAISIAGFLFYNNQKKSLKQEKWDDLGAISDLKVSQIVNWRKERIEDGAIIFESPFIAPRILRWFQDPETTGAMKELLGWMKSLQRLQQYQSYQSVLLLEPKGNMRLSVPEGEKLLDPFSKQLVLEAAQNKRVMLSDLYRDDISNVIRLSLLVPILLQTGEKPVTVAVILLRIDPQLFLYPLIQTWPTSSHSSETLLIRREGEEVVFLNELRHRKNTALVLRSPVSRQDLPAAMVARGQVGIAEGLDYRGVAVLAALRRIPDSPWFLVAKIDREEIYAPIRWESRLIAILSGVLVLVVGVSVGFLWRGQHLQEQRRSEREIRQLNEDLKRRAVKLESVNKELEAFSYSASHDLRTPLLGINGVSGILLDKYSSNLEEKGKDYLRLIRKETQNMLQLIDGLMAFSRFERQEVKLSLIDMVELTRTVVDELKTMMPDQGLSVNIRTLPPAHGDRTMIQQVFYNLLSNAFKFAKPKEAGIIEVGSITGENDNIYYVKDNGVGFDMQHAAKVFEVFQRLHSADKFEGSGIGLAIVQRIVERHGGRVWADGKVNEGATFYFTLLKEEGDR